MSRGQQSSVIDTAKSQNSTNFGNSQSAFGDTQSDIGDYQKQLASFVSGNPYTKGGEYDQTVNPSLAATSDAGSNSLKGALQSQALKTGQNSAANAATAAAGAQANTRALSSDEASAQQQRISGETGYNTTALGATSTPISAESGLFGSAGGQANSELGTQESASQTPGFWDEVGTGLAGNLGRVTGSTSGGGSIGVCWVAAECWGWEDPRTVLLRGWLLGTVQYRRFGRLIVAAYRRFGERAAQKMRSSRVIRWVLTKLCHLALRQAQKEQGA